jgi:hypothetical protein
MKSLHVLWLNMFILLITVPNLIGQTAVVRFELHTLSQTNPDHPSVFLTGSFNCWNPYDTLYMMKKSGDNSYSLDVPVFSGHTYEYKYTRGDWSTVELSSTGMQLDNRKMLSRDGLVIKDTVADWASPSVAVQSDTSEIDRERMEALMKLKDELSAKVNDQVKPVTDLLKQAVENMLSENPDSGLRREYHLALVARVDSIVGSASDFLWKLTSLLTPEQKKEVALRLNESDDPGVIIDMITNSVLISKDQDKNSK